MKHARYASLFGLCVLAGCRSGGVLATPEAETRRETSAKLHNGMSEAEATAALGQPAEFRPGNGKKDDVAVYRVKDQNFTIYFYQDRLTRYVSSQQPVNP